MDTLDFGRSFVTFVTPGHTNNARIQVECRVTLTAPDADPLTYLLLASCKGEDTYGAGDLFLQPNYDFCGIFSPHEYMIIRAHAASDLGGKEIGDISPRFDHLVIQLCEAEADDCEDDEEVVSVTLHGLPIVGITTIRDEATSREAVIEYPIKTMNVNDIDAIWQVDTGPALFPDLTADASRPIERFDLAFIAYSRLDRAEFILQVPTPVASGDGEVLVPHYSQTRKLAATNRIVALR